jgi:hypothetical protein
MLMARLVNRQTALVFSVFIALIVAGAFLSRTTLSRGRLNVNPIGSATAPLASPNMPVPPSVTVTNNNDSGSGSLRDAIANVDAGGTIDFDPMLDGQTITLTSGELLIDKSLTIQGPTSGGLTISGGNTSRIFNVNASVNFTFSNLTISGGNAATGGGVNNLGNLTILNSTLTGNSSTGHGGAILTEGGVVRIINSTISGNTAGNGAGGGLYNGDTSQTTITNSTITNNNEGIRHIGNSPLRLNNTIVARNPDCGSCDGSDIFVDNLEDMTVTLDPASSNNLIGVGTGAVGISNGVNGNQIGSAEAPLDPLLAPLANNGGPTLTHALNNLSPAIDTGNNALALDQNNAALTTDQRGTGFPRIEHSVVDIGAYEKTFVPPPPTADVSVSKAAGNEESLTNRDIVYTITVTNAGPDAAASVALNDTLPGDLTFVSMPTPAGWSCATPSVGSGGVVNCTNSSLAVSSVVVFTLTVHIPVSTSETDYHNVATVSTDTNDSNPGNNSSSANVTLVSCLTNPIVVSNADSGAGSLRQAIIDACDGSTITFDVNQVVSPITLTSGELLINKNLTINGPGANLLTISGNNASRVFNIQAAMTAEISGLSITNGNTASDGGGIVNHGTLTLSASGVANSSSPGSGGGIVNVGGATMTINGSTITGNTSPVGAGIANGGALTIVNSTISANNGIGFTNSAGTATITNSTISGNTNVGIEAVASVNIGNSIVAKAQNDNPDVTGTFVSQGNNLIGDKGGSTGFTNGVNGDQVGIAGALVNPLLGALANNGGPTQTQALLPGSPAINAGNNTLANNASLTTDQRGAGFDRIVNTTVDIGAFESRGFTISTTSGTPQSAVFNTAFADPLVATVSSSFGEPVDGGQVTFTAPGAGASAKFTGGVSTINAAIASGQASVSATANSTVGGPYEVTGTGNGITGAASFSLTNIKANQTIEFAPIADKTFGDPDFDVSPIASSGFSVSLAASGNCTVTSPSPGTVHITAAGSCTITASQAGDTHYNPAPNVQQSFTINKANQTITFNALANKTFGDPDFSVSATTTSGLPVSLAASGNCTVTSPSPGTVHLTAAGSCTITASQAGDSNYNPATSVPQSFTINKANQTITFNALTNRTFGDPDFAVGATTTSGLPVSLAASGNCTVTSPSPGTVHITGAGSCTITASQAGDSNYNAATSVPQSFTINKANQTITFNALLNKTFGEPDFAVSATTTSGLPVSLAASGNCTVTSPSPGTVHLTGAGSCTITASQAGNANFNAAANVPQSFSIAKANTSTVVSSSVNPSDLNQSVTFRADVTSVAAKTGTVQFKDNGTNLGAPVALDASGVALLSTSSLTTGTHAITAEYSGDASFLPSTGTLPGGQVVRAQPSLSINDVSIIEGNAGTKVLNFTVTLSAASSLTVTANFATANGTAVTPADYVATNGTLTFNPGETTKTIPVTINGDVSFEADETFTVNLSNPVNATISDNQGRGTIQNDDALGGFISFTQSNYNVNENAGVVTLTVTRGFVSFDQIQTQDVSQAANVDYATDDTGASTNCAALNTGLASQRCDYTSVFGTLKFAANETQKTIDIPINLDGYTEGPEVFTVKLSNPTGGAVAVPSTATVTISDWSSPPPNAIDDTANFVRQQYRDFLNRDADPAGLAFWKDNIDKCNDPARRPANQTVAQCIEVQRIVTSAAFFLSIEFKQTGGTVREFYVAALNRPLTNNMPGFVEFLRDTQAIQKGVVVGQGNWQQVLDFNRIAFMNEFVMRAEFVGLYPTTDTPAQYVDKLYLHANVTPGSAQERLNAIGEFNGAFTAADPGARGRALLRITQNAAFQAREANRTFVQIEYFGYLRRDPDIAGFNFWVNKLNQFNGDFLQAEMVKAFLSSLEYRSRFGP